MLTGSVEKIYKKPSEIVTVKIMENIQILLEDTNMVRQSIFFFFIVNVIMVLSFVVLPETKAASIEIPLVFNY